MLPSARTRRGEGIPWTISSSIEMQSVLGKPYRPLNDGTAPSWPRMNFSAAASRSSVVMPGRTIWRIRSSVPATIRPARAMISISREDLSVIICPARASLVRRCPRWCPPRGSAAGRPGARTSPAPARSAPGRLEAGWRRPRGVSSARPSIARRRSSRSRISSSLTSKNNTASILRCFSARIRSSPSACGMVRTTPSKITPFDASGFPSSSRTTPRMMSSPTRWPASITALASRPSGVSRLTASRSRSPVANLGRPSVFPRIDPCVPFPAPGGPKRRISMRCPKGVRSEK